MATSTLAEPSYDAGVRALKRPAVLGGFALVSLAASIGLSVYILLPKKEFTLSLARPDVYERLFGVRGDEEEVRRRLVYWLEVYWQANQARIDELGVPPRGHRSSRPSADLLVVG